MWASTLLSITVLSGASVGPLSESDSAKGKSIMIQHDVTSPRPYSRIHLLSGTKGFVQKWPVQGIALDTYAKSNRELAQSLEKFGSMRI